MLDDADDYWHFPDPSQDPLQTSLYTSVEPLHAQVIEIRWPSDARSAYIWMPLEECEGASNPNACHLEAQKSLHSIIYVEGEEDCETHTGIGGFEGQRALSIDPSNDPSKRYFAVLANTDFTERKGYQIRMEYSDAN